MKARNWTHLYPEYAGRWVAFAKNQETVIANATTLSTALQKAKRQGYKNPVVFKVPQEMLPYVGTR